MPIHFQDAFLRKSVESLSWRVAGILALFLMHIVLGRHLTLEDYGVLNYTISATKTATLFTTLGFPTLIVSLLPRYKESNNWSTIRGFTLRCLQLPLLFSLLISVFLSTVYPGIQYSESILFFSLFLPIMSLITVGRHFFLGLHHLRGFIIPEEILLPILVIISVFFLATDEVAKVLVIYFWVLLFVLSVTLIWLKKVLPTHSLSSKNIYHTKDWLITSIPLLLGGASQLLMSQMGVLLLGQLDSMRNVGLFSAAMRFSLLITFVMTAINMVGAPIIAREFHRKTGGNLAEVVRQARIWSSLGAMVVFLPLFFYPGWFLGLMGGEFLEGVVLLRIIACGYMANAMTGLAGTVLTMTGHGSYFGKTTFLAMLLCLAAMLLSIPTWGATGAAISFSLVLAGMNIVHLWRANFIVCSK